jgi:hypothetical protein
MRRERAEKEVAKLKEDATSAAQDVEEVRAKLKEAQAHSTTAAPVKGEPAKGAPAAKDNVGPGAKADDAAKPGAGDKPAATAKSPQNAAVQANKPGAAMAAGNPKQ